MKEHEIEEILSSGIRLAKDTLVNSIIEEIQLDTKLVILKILSRKLEAEYKIVQ